MDPEKCCESGCTPCERDPVGSEPRDLCNYIDGEFICHSNDDWMNVLKPATGERFGRVPLSTQADVDHAISAAKRLSQHGVVLAMQKEPIGWIKSPMPLEAKYEDIAALESKDTGKPISLARAVDAYRSVANFRFFAD